MDLHEPTIRHDPRAGHVSGLVHALSQRSALLTTDQERFKAVSDALAEILDFDRLTIAILPEEGQPPVPVFQRGGSRDAPPSDNDVGPGPVAGLRNTSVAADAGTVVSNKAVLNYYDASKESCRQVISCPVVIDGLQSGLIELELTTRDERQFSRHDLWIVETIGNTSTLALALIEIKSGGERRAQAAAGPLTGELADLMMTEPAPAVVMERIAERVAAIGYCDVLLMRYESGGWIGTEPVVRDADPSRVRARRLLLDRLRNLQPSMSFIDPAETNVVETAMLANLVSEVRDVLGQLPEQPHELDEVAHALVFSLPSELGGPLVLVALRSDPGVQQFTEADRSAIWRAIQSLSPALLSATLADRLDRASRERDAMLRMVRAIGAGRTTLDRIKVACRTVQLLLAYDYVAITDWNTEPPTIRFEAGRTATGPVTLVHKGTVTDVGRYDEPRIITDFPKIPPLDTASYPLHVAEELSASLTFRLQWSGKTFGSLILGYRRPHHFPPTERRFAESIAHVIMASLGPELSRPERA